MSDELLVAANGGDSHAQYTVGCCCALGQGVAIDPTEAARWWRLAADQGHPGAQFNLARLHMRGEGVRVDPQLPHSLFRAAARGYGAMIDEGAELTGLDLRKARRDAVALALFTFPPYLYWSVRITLARVGLGRFRAFQQAAQSHNVQQVTGLLVSGMRVNAHARSGATPLIHVSRVGATSVVRLLIERGADVNLRGLRHFEVPPIHAGAQSGELPVVELLLEHGAEPNEAAPDGSTAVMVAAIQGSVEMISVLSRYGADVNATAANGGTALHAAAQGGCSESVLRLLTAGADPHTAGLANGETPLFSAAMSGDVKTIQVLIDAGADVNAKNDTGLTPLHRAAVNDHGAAVGCLVAAGADFAASGTDDGYTPLHSAALRGAHNAAMALLEAGSRIDMESDFGETPLDIAMARGDAALVELLQSHGDDM